MAQSVWGEARSHSNLWLLIVEVNKEGGVRGGVKGRHHESWNGF